MDLKNLITLTTTQLLDSLKSATTQEELETLRLTYLSRHGTFAQLMNELKNLSLEEKRALGPLMNESKTKAQAAFDAKVQELQAQKIQQELQKQQYFDVTASVPQALKGTLHPITQLIERIENIFISMGFEVVSGPEVETERYNFEALNIPPHHPAREFSDTFFLTNPGLLLRTHTSTVQIRTMEKQKPPLAILAHGRVYRHEATDATHDFMFMQAEVLVIDKNINMSHLLATGKTFLQALFEKKDLDIRVRASYFPFVEPGVEFDMTCPFCTSGCSICKKTRWIEICGAGLVHPNVLKSCEIDPTIYSGFAFGFGLTRLVMLMYGINDIRLLHQPTMNFLRQF